MILRPGTEVVFLFHATDRLASKEFAVSYLRRIKVLAARPRGRSLHPAIELLEDRTTPAVSTPILVATSDTGFSSTDRLTMDNTPTFTGTATPGVAVQLREESAILGSATANAAGNWTITTIVLTNGVHDIFARDNTNSINSATVDVTIDTLAPAVSLADLDPLSDNGFSNSDNITNDNTPTFSGSAEAGATVQLREGSTLHGSTFGSSRLVHHHLDPVERQPQHLRAHHRRRRQSGGFAEPDRDHRHLRAGGLGPRSRRVQ